MKKSNRVIHKTVSGSIIFLIWVLIFCGCEGDSSNPYVITDVATPALTGKLETEAIRIIREGLSSEYPQVRTNAIETAASLPPNRANEFMPEVQKLLNDKYVPVRFSAAVATGDTRYSPAISDIMQLLKDEDSNVRLAANYAIAKLNGSTAAQEQIRKELTSSDQRVRANAVFLLGKIGNTAVLGMLYEAMNDENSDDSVRLSAIEAIARLGDENIYQKIWAILISAYADDRVTGIRAMGALGNTQSSDALLTMLKDDVPEVRLVAAEQLGNLGDTAGEGVVLDTLENASNTRGREEKARIETLCALAIGQIRTPALKKFLPTLINSESQFTRFAAAKAVLQCGMVDNIGR